MTLHKSMWKAAVLMGIVGILMFAGGLFAGDLTDINVTGTAAEVVVGGTINLSVTYTPSDASDLGDYGEPVWESSDADIAEVENGVVTGVAEGSVTITAKVSKDNGSIWITSSPGYSVEVKPAPSGSTLAVVGTPTRPTLSNSVITFSSSKDITSYKYQIGGTAPNNAAALLADASATNVSGAVAAGNVTLSLSSLTDAGAVSVYIAATDGTNASNMITAQVPAFSATALGITVTDVKYGASPGSNDTAVVEGNIRSVDAIKVTATITPSTANVGGARDTSLRFRWFQKSASGAITPADNIAAPGSEWKSKADGGDVFAIPSTLTAKASAGGDSLYYFFCRVRSTILKANGTVDSIDAVASALRTITVKTRPKLEFTTTVANGNVDPSTFKITGSGMSGAVAGADSVSGTVGLVLKLTEDVKKTVYATNGSGTTTNDGSGVTYQWYRNNTASNIGGILVSGTGANTKELTLEPDMAVGNYYFFLEASAAGALPIRTTVLRVQIIPGGDAIALPALNQVQFQGGAPASITYDYSKVMALAVPAEGTALVSPTYGPNKAVKFKVTEMIYQGIDDYNSGEYFHYKSTGTIITGTTCTKLAPCKLESNKTPAVGLQKTGKYSVTVIVENTETTHANDGGLAAGKVKGSTSVVWTIEQKDINNILTKDNSLKNGATYDGTTKNPVFTLEDGTSSKKRTLAPGTDYIRNDSNLTNAGLAFVDFVGAGNYKGTLRLSFQIAKKTISVDAVSTSATAASANSGSGYFTKPYDGTTDVLASAAGVDVKFTGLVNSSDITLGKGYTVSGLKFDNANVATNRTVTGTVTLVDGDTNLLSRNYTFGTSLSSSFTVSGAIIKQKLLTGLSSDDVKDIFSYKIPLHRLFTGKEQDIGTVGWNTAKYSSTGDTKTLYYTESGAGLGAVKDKPVRAGTYAVTMDVSGSNNFGNATGISLGNFVIGTEKTPTLVFTDSLAIDPVTGAREAAPPSFEVKAYKNEAITLKAIGYRPDSSLVELRANGDADSAVYYKSGTISYRWYTKSDKSDTLKLSNKTPVTTATYTVTYSAAVEDNKDTSYWVEATYTNANVQVATTSALEELKVTVKPERVDISSATVTIGGSYVYSGKSVDSATVAAGGVTVTLKGSDLVPEDDYTIVVDGEEAGLGLVTVTGVNGYKGKASGTFVIDRAETSEDSLVFNPPSTSVQYNGAAQPISVKPNSGEGLGTVTIRYVDISDDENPDTLDAAPKNAGKYVALISIAEGKNYTAFYTEDEPFEREYTITKRFVAKEDLDYTMPSDGDTPAPIVATLKNPMDYAGTITIVYYIVEGSAPGTTLSEVPTTEGKYIVRARLSGDDNFGAVTVPLDTLRIDSLGLVGIKAANRVIPATPAVKVVSVAPVKAATAATFTAGPSPVSKASGKIAFFSTKSVKSGSLYIFDASGNAVAKLSAKAGTGEIASWNLKDKKGVVVAEGTYVVKGALAGKDGTREKVSFVFSVVK